MALADELAAEAQASADARHASQITEFIERLDPEDRAAVDDWIKSRRSTEALYRVLKRRGLPVASSTFRGWVKRRVDSV